MPDNGSEWRKFGVVPRSHPLRPLVLYLGLLGLEAEGAFSLPGKGGDHFHKKKALKPTLDPLLGHFQPMTKKTIFDPLLCQINCLTISALRDLRPIIILRSILQEPYENLPRSIWVVLGIPIAWYKARIPVSSPKIIREGASGLWVRAGETQKSLLHRCNLGVALGQETI